MKTKVNKPDGTVKSSRSFFSKQNASGFFAVQPKLTVGQPGDKYEQEADRVAEQVVDGASEEQSFFAPATSPNLQSKPLVETISPLVQMRSEEEEEAQTKLEIQCQEEEEEEMMQMQPLEEEEEMLQPKANHGAKSPKSIELLLKMNQANGSSLDNKTRGKMEQSFGADFSDVKIHTDNAAVQMNKELGAQAFTSGNDIYFNKGKYDPGSQNGNKLLAHELTHTVQQGASKGTSETSSLVQCDNGTVETSEGIEEIEGLEVTSSADDIRMRLLTSQPLINETINRWIRENFDFVADSMETAAESFENWYSLHSSSNNTTFVFDVISGGLGILAAAYPPAGIAAAILGAVVNIAKTARDSQATANNITQGNAATVVEQSMVNKAHRLRNSSIGFAEQLKTRNENIWNNAGVGITMNDRNVEVFAKQQFYAELGIAPINRNLARRALTDMIHAYTNWERGNSLRSSIMFVSAADLEWAFQSEGQRRGRAARRAEEQLEIDNPR
jgi:hypothetical protein